MIVLRGNKRKEWQKDWQKDDYDWFDFFNFEWYWFLIVIVFRCNKDITLCLIIYIMIINDTACKLA